MSEAMSGGRRALLIGAAGVSACAVGVLGGHWWLTRGVVKGEEAKLLGASFEGLDGGKPTPMSTWQGKTLVINFWATWCGPCRVEFPELVRIDGDYRARGLRTALVSVDNRGAMESIVADFLQSYASTMPSYLLDLPKGRSLARAVRKIAPNARAGIPLTLLFDARGRLVYQKSGVLDARVLRARLDRLLTVKTTPAVVK